MERKRPQIVSEVTLEISDNTAAKKLLTNMEKVNSFIDDQLRTGHQTVRMLAVDKFMKEQKDSLVKSIDQFLTSNFSKQDFEEIQKKFNELEDKVQKIPSLELGPGVPHEMDNFKSLFKDQLTRINLAPQNAKEKIYYEIVQSIDRLVAELINELKTPPPSGLFRGPPNWQAKIDSLNKNYGRENESGTLLTSIQSATAFYDEMPERYKLQITNALEKLQDAKAQLKLELQLLQKSLFNKVDSYNKKWNEKASRAELK